MKSEKNEQSNESSQEGKVAEALRSLPRIEAPGDFEMRVKARIAERGSDGASLRPRLPRFAFAFAAVAVVVTGAVVMFTLRSGPSDTATTGGAEKIVPPAASEVSPPSMAKSSVNRPDVERNGNSPLSNQSGVVREEAVKQAQEIDLGMRPGQPAEGQSAGSVGVSDVMLAIGAEVSFEGGVWVVRNVVSGSRAAASGVKTGDAVFAVDGITLRSDTRLATPFSGKMLLIKRPGSEKLTPLPIK